MSAPDLARFRWSELDAELLADPYPFYRALREQGPVFQEPDFGAFVVTRYDDIVHVHRRPEVFSSIDIGAAPFRPLPCPVGDLRAWRDAQEYPERLITNDPPDHTRHRRLINRLFTPRRVAALEPRIRTLANEVIDEFIDDREVEFVSAYANLLPRVVVGELLGVPAEDAARLKEHFKMRNTAVRDMRWDAKELWSSILSISREHVPANELERVLGMGDGAPVLEYFREAIAERREDPSRGDILTELANARFADGEEVPLNTLLVMVLLLYVAGGDANTTELLSNSLLLLARRPVLAQAVRADEALVEPFVEEVLRWDSPLLGVFRVAVEDTAIADVPIPKGAVVLLAHGSANHDETHFDDPEQFDLQRTVRQAPLSFGHGAHFCPGAPLARLEGRVTVTEVLRRMGDLRLLEGDEVSYLPSVIQRTPTRLLLGFDKLA